MISRSQTKFPTFIIFLIFFNNSIAGCDLASPGPPDLEHIWGPKWQPVYGLFYITIICNFYEIYELFHKPCLPETGFTNVAGKDNGNCSKNAVFVSCNL